MRKAIVTMWLILLMSFVGCFFWYNEYTYALPTPVPVNYKNIKPGEYVSLQKELVFNNNKPVFLHFFNPDCPCSKFNFKQFKTLVKSYQRTVNFAIVLSTAKPYTAQEIQQKFDIDIPVITDSTLAKKCGVYSTPQAVILKNAGELYFRGNYNKSRYCTDPKSDYAKIALDSLLNHKQVGRLDQYVLTAYGCSIENCAK
jgi:hypothetical protein